VILYRIDADLVKFQKDFDDVRQCCGEGMPSDVLMSLMNTRLCFYSLDMEEQSAEIITRFRLYHNIKTDKIEVLMAKWPLCEGCYKAMMGLSDYRWKKYMDAYRLDNKTTRFPRKVESHERTAPVSDFFLNWLTSLKEFVLYTRS
jgi:hypothetical protein